MGYQPTFQHTRAKTPHRPLLLSPAHIYSRMPPAYSRIPEEQEEQPLFCLENISRAGFALQSCSLSNGLQEPSRGRGWGWGRANPQGTEGIPLARTPACLGPGSTRKRERLCLFISGGAQRLFLGSGQFLHRQQRCGAVLQRWGAVDVFLDLLNESIMFFLLFSHLHRQLLPAERGRVICLFVGRRKTQNRAVP